MNPSLKRAVITAGLETIALTGAGRFLPGAAGHGMVFTLHHVRPVTNRQYEPNALLSVTPDFLDAAIREVKGRGYIPVALDELPNAVATAKAGERYVAFTLDDGCRDNAEHAAPVFRKHDVPYMLFITKGLAERTHTMWWETAEELTRLCGQFKFDFGSGIETVMCATTAQKHVAFLRLADFIESIDEDAAVARLNDMAVALGIDPAAIVDKQVMDVDALRTLAKDPLARFGVHTVSHCNLARVDADRLEREIVEPIESIKGWTGMQPQTIAYPYGWKRACTEREASAARQAGLTVGVTTQPGVVNDAGNNDWRLLPRVSLNGLYQKRRYVRALLSGIPFRLI